MKSKIIAFAMAILMVGQTSSVVLAEQIKALPQEIQMEPNSIVNRGMIVMELAMIYWEYWEGVSTFTDVPADSAFAQYIGWASEKGIVKGVGNNKFNPNGSVTREELAVIFDNYLKMLNYDFPKDEVITKFKDNDKISSWAIDSVYKMKVLGIISGNSENIFNPKGNATREQVNIMLEKLQELAQKIRVAGGYSDERDVTAEDIKIFEEATQNLTGVSYKPLKVSTQVVAGLNYKFSVTSKAVTPDAKEYPAYIFIFKPLGDGKATVTDIVTPQIHD